MIFSSVSTPSAAAAATLSAMTRKIASAGDPAASLGVAAAGLASVILVCQSNKKPPGRRPTRRKTRVTSPIAADCRDRYADFDCRGTDTCE
jgi:hypothetical protein